MSENYEWKLWVKVMSENYDLVVVYQSRRKFEIYNRDTVVSKNVKLLMVCKPN